MVANRPVDRLGADLRVGLVLDAGDRARLMQVVLGGATLHRESALGQGWAAAKEAAKS